MLMTPDDIAKMVIDRQAYAVSLRGTLDGHLKEVAERCFPGASQQFNELLGTTQGEKRTEHMVDTTAALAADRAASIMESILTPRSSTWHAVLPQTKELRKNRLVMEWFQELNDALFQYRYAPQANFASQKRADYKALAVFGTGCLFTDILEGRGGVGTRYKYIPFGEMHFLENHQGLVDTTFRKFKLTARQAMQQFSEPEDQLPEEIINDAKSTKSDNQEKDHFFIHCVKPRTAKEGFEEDRLDNNGLPWTDYYVSVTGIKLVRTGGHNTFPFAISRYDVAPGEIYGRSPAMTALPTIKVLNEQKKTILKQGHKTVDPVIIAHDDGVLDTFSLKPGAINYGGVNAQGQKLVSTLPVGNLSLAQEMMQMEQQTINDFFMISLFQILTENPQMTATEVLERTREKGMLLSPTMGRQESESLNPMIEREVDLLMQQQLISPMPDALREAGGRFQIQYSSPLSRAQKAEETVGLFRTVDWLSSVINITQDPEPLDYIDWDGAVPDILSMQAVPLRWQKTADQVQAIREARQQQRDQQTAIQAAPAVAALQKNASEAPAP